MVDIKELKESVESGDVFDTLIFIVGDSTFLANQYIRKIADNKGVEIKYIDNIEEALITQNNIFDTETTESILVYRCDEFAFKYDGLQNVIVVAKQIEKETQKIYDGIIVKFPKIQNWQVEEYAKKNLVTVDDDTIQEFLQCLNYDIDRIDVEISKFIGFPKERLNEIFKKYTKDLVEDNPKETIISFINAIQHKDIYTIQSCMQRYKDIGVDPIGFLAITTQSFKKILQVWSVQNPTEKGTGIKENQIWAIKKLPRVYSTQQIYLIYQFLLKCDYLVKSGLISTDCFIDYIVCNIFDICGV